MLALVVAVAFVACGSDDSDERAEDSSSADAEDSQTSGDGDVADECPSIEGEEDVVLSISRPILAFAPILLGIESGAFEDAGLNVSIEPLSASEALAPLSQGRIDASLTSYSTGYFNAAASGIDVRWVMPAYEAPPESQIGYWVRTDVAGTAEEPTLENLAGEKVGSPTAGTGTGGLILDNAVAEAGLSLEDLDLTQLSGADALIALENGAVAGAWLSDPIWIEAQDNPDLRFLAGYEPGVNGSGLVIGPGLIERPDVMTVFSGVVLDVIDEYLGEGHLEDEETLAMLSDALDTPVESLAEGEPLVYNPELSLDGAEEWLGELQQFLLDEGDLEFTEPLDTSTLVDDSYVDKALACR